MLSTFTSNTFHHSSGSLSQLGPEPLAVPALAASRSIGPISRSTSATIRSTAALSVTSTLIASPPISCAISST